jgi:VWFA-related protein
MRITSFIFQIFIAVLFLLFISTLSQAQDTNGSKTQQEMQLFVTVTDSNGNFITGLRGDNFKLFDGEKQQIINNFAFGNEPISVAILFDKSKSAETIHFEAVQKALPVFIKLSHSNNEYSLIAFNETQKFVFDSLPQSSAIKAIENLSAIKPEGNTKLLDAIYAGAENMQKSKHSKQVLILISDAQENGSKLGFNTTRNMLRKSNALFYSISFLRPNQSNTKEALQTQAYLDEFASATGGSSYYPQTLTELNSVFSRLTTELQSQYKLSFLPNETFDKKEQWRKVKVKTDSSMDSSKVGKVFVRTREGYYLTSNQQN